MKSPRSSVRSSAFTLIELLVVIGIVAILAALLVPGFTKVKTLAEAAKSVSNLRNVALSTVSWSADHGNKLPSPQYPGGIEVPSGTSEDDVFPKYWNLAESGLWLDGVIFGILYLEEQARRKEEEAEENGESAEEGDGSSTFGYKIDEKGTHLRGTLFESAQSVKKNSSEADWHRHSYAMNANLQYDRIYDKIESTDPYLTEKTLTNLPFSPNAILFIDCIETNVIRFEDRQMVVDAINERWAGGKGIAAYLDGHADRISESDIPAEDPETNRDSSRFWRGVDPKRPDN